MSDKTEREYRQNMLTILDRFYRGRGQSLLTKDESEALDYAISSIKTDLKYDLLYEETKHIADADKKIESTTKNVIRDNRVKNELNRVKNELEPTTKNDLGVDAVSRQAVLDLIADYDLSMGQVVKGIHALPSVTPQEPFINKPCISSGVCEQDKNKVLDKIRAEITAIAVNGQVDEHTMFIRAGEQVKQMALDIIDKYKAESEK